MSAPEVKRTFSVAGTGRGRPDYSVRIEEIRRGETLVKFAPRPNELQEIFYLNFHPDETLGVGEIQHLIRQEDGSRMPYTSPAGYLVEQRERLICFNGYVRLTLRLDNLDPIILYPEPDVITHITESLARLESKNWDPNGESTHEWDFTVTNIDNIALQGMVQMSLILVEA